MLRAVEIPGEARCRLAEVITTRMRELCGRGPRNVRVRAEGGEVTIEIDGFMTPYEETLAADEANFDLVAQMRERVLRRVADEYAAVLERLLGVRVLQLTGEVDLRRNRRTIHVKVA